MSVQNDFEANTMAIDYGFCPGRLLPPDAGRTLRYGKYEPDNFPAADQRWMILAETMDHTNILILYEPDNLEE